MNNPVYLIVGYGVTLAAIVAYLLRLRRLERAVRGELDARRSAAGPPSTDG